MNEVKIPYKPRLLVFFLATLFFAALTALFIYIASTDDRGLILFRIIEMSASGAKLFYWGLAIVSALFTVVGIGSILSSLTSKKQLTLTDHSISAPKSTFSSKIVTVNYHDILDLKLQAVQKEEFLEIFHPGGKLTISKSMLPSKQAFDDVVGFVANKLNARM